jgi:hypothetical protein
MSRKRKEVSGYLTTRAAIYEPADTVIVADPKPAANNVEPVGFIGNGTHLCGKYKINFANGKYSTNDKAIIEELERRNYSKV